MNPFTDLTSVLCSLWRRRSLAFEMAKREIADKHVGALIGVIWAFIQPLFVIGLYIVVFALVFRVRLREGMNVPADYTVYLLSGLVPWLAVQDALVRGCTAISANPSLVKQVIFPMEVLVAKSMLVALFSQLICLTLLCGYLVFTVDTFTSMLLLVPVILVLQWVGLLGMALILASLGTFVRDLRDVVQLFATGGVYLVPAVYLPEWLPPAISGFLYLNPFSYLVWCWQDVLFYQSFAHPQAWWAWTFFSVLSLGLGAWTFQRLRLHFANVL
jgi:lipopolysaccharide transport system permease protein